MWEGHAHSAAQQGCTILNVPALSLLPPERMTASSKPGTSVSATWTPFSGITCCTQAHTHITSCALQTGIKPRRLRKCALGQSASHSMTHVREHHLLQGGAPLTAATRWQTSLQTVVVESLA